MTIYHILDQNERRCVLATEKEDGRLTVAIAVIKPEYRVDCADMVRLANAAPDLLAACDAIVSSVSQDLYRKAAAEWGRAGDADDAFAQMRAAIAKAKGAGK